MGVSGVSTAVEIGDGVELGAMGGAVAMYTPAESGVGLGGPDVAVRTGVDAGSGVGSGAEVGDGGGAEVGTAVEVGASAGVTARDRGAGVGTDVGVSGAGTTVAVGSDGSGVGDRAIVAEVGAAIGSWTDCS